MAKNEVAKGSDESVGLSLSWSWSGITGRIRSRFVSSADHLGAIRVDQSGLEAEREIALHRANTEAYLELMAAATQAVTSELKSEPEKARHALAIMLREGRKLNNVEECLGLALEDLRNRPDLSEALNEEGPDQLNADFVDRWGRYAEGANTEEARERWGRILAGEIRTPGTFTMKTLRVMDELSTEVAEIFQRLCEARIGTHGAPLAIANLTRQEVDTLEEADLVQPSVLGRYLKLRRFQRADGREVYMHNSSVVGWAVDVDEVDSLKSKLGLNNDGLPFYTEDTLALPVLGFTAVGRAIASIISTNQDDNVLKLANLIGQRLSFSTLVLYRRLGDNWELDHSWPSPNSDSSGARV